MATKTVKKGRTANLTNAGKGRKKGSKNRVGKNAKESVEEIFKELGGIEGAVKHFKKKENRNDFYCKVWPKILPKDVKLEHSGTVTHETESLQAFTDSLREITGSQKDSEISPPVLN